MALWSLNTLLIVPTCFTLGSNDFDIIHISIRDAIFFPCLQVNDLSSGFRRRHMSSRSLVLDKLSNIFAPPVLNYRVGPHLVFLLMAAMFYFFIAFTSIYSWINRAVVVSSHYILAGLAKNVADCELKERLSFNGIVRSINIHNSHHVISILQV